MKGRRAKKNDEGSLEAYVMLGMLCAAVILYIFYSYQYHPSTEMRESADTVPSEGMMVHDTMPASDYYDDMYVDEMPLDEMDMYYQ